MIQPEQVGNGPAVDLGGVAVRVVTVRAVPRLDHQPGRDHGVQVGARRNRDVARHRRAGVAHPEPRGDVLRLEQPHGVLALEGQAGDGRGHVPQPVVSENACLQLDATGGLVGDPFGVPHRRERRRAVLTDVVAHVEARVVLVPVIALVIVGVHAVAVEVVAVVVGQEVDAIDTAAAGCRGADRRILADGLSVGGGGDRAGGVVDECRIVVDPQQYGVLTPLAPVEAVANLVARRSLVGVRPLA